MKKLVTVFEYVSKNDNHANFEPISSFNWIFCVISPDGSDDVCQFELYAFEDRIDKIISHTYPRLRPTVGVRRLGYEFKTPSGLIYTGTSKTHPTWTRNKRIVPLHKLNPENYRFYDEQLIKKN
jgi:hypothetical protein